MDCKLTTTSCYFSRHVAGREFKLGVIALFVTGPPCNGDWDASSLAISRGIFVRVSGVAEPPYNNLVFCSKMKIILRITKNRIYIFRKTDICDNMITLLENYSSELEHVVSQRTRQLRDEKQKTDALLDRMLPR